MRLFGCALCRGFGTINMSSGFVLQGVFIRSHQAACDFKVNEDRGSSFGKVKRFRMVDGTCEQGKGTRLRGSRANFRRRVKVEIADQWAAARLNSPIPFSWTLPYRASRVSETSSHQARE